MKDIFQIEENQYPMLFYDITSKCDMNCNICYAKDIEIQEPDLVFFEDLVSRLPNKNIYFMLLGGEPTIAPQFFPILDIIFKYKHSAFICTNGKRISSDIEFIKELKTYSQKGNMKFHMDVSGGLDPKLYKRLHNTSKSLDYKLKALENIRKYKLGKVTIGTVLVRGVNEQSIDDMFKISKEYSDIIIEVFCRSMINEGSFILAEPYTTNGIINLLLKKKFINKKDLNNIFLSGMLNEKCEGQHCCFKILKDRKIIGFYDCQKQICWQRGRIVNNRNYIESYTSSLNKEFIKNK